MSDSYKVSHGKLLPSDATNIYSYFESRGGKWDNVVFFGLQYLLKEYFVGQVVRQEYIEEADELFRLHFGRNIFNRAGWERILKIYNGRLPICIRAVPEGSVIGPNSNVLMTIENTDPECAWLTNYLETLLVQLWYPCTVATQSREMKKIIAGYLEKTGDPALIDFKLHDFGYRGVSSEETAGIGAAAHLINFKGTDTLAGIVLLRKYYNEKMAGFSIPASEHSTICSWGRENEAKAMENMLDKYPSGIIACVSDSYDIWNACENIWGTQLRDKILNRDGVLVIRPDCYDNQTEILTDSGWKLFENLQTQDYVAQCDHNGIVQFVKPIKHINQQYNGIMYSIKDKIGRIDLLITPNHRLPLYDKIKNEFYWQTAENFTRHHHPYTFLQASHQKNFYTQFQKLTPLDRLKIAFQADGSFPSKMSRTHIGQICIRFNFAKQRKADRLIEICKLGKFRYKISHEPSRPQNYNIYVWLDQYPSKDFKWINLNNIDQTWAQEFIEELSYWDATRRSKTRYKYDTTIAINADIVQSICVLAGYSCYYGIHRDDRKIQFSDVHSLTIRINTNLTGLQKIKINRIQYEGQVYCVQVPSGMIVIRRNHKVLISGNSGHPPTILVNGNPNIFTILGDKFGYTVNEKGYKVLNPKIRVIQGDGIDFNMLGKILEAMQKGGWSADNIAFGSGGGLLQKLDRDTLSFAFKCSSTVVNGQQRDVWKDPVTSSAKSSKRGRLKLVKDGLKYKTVRESDDGEDVLRTVFENGKLLIEDDFATIRERAKL